MREQGGGGPGPFEGWLAGQALVEHAAQRVDVGAVVERLVGALLGGGVVDRAGKVGAHRDLLVAGAARQPEVREVAVLLAALLGDEHIGRFDVAMHEPVRVGGVEGAPHLGDELDRAGRLQRPLRSSSVRRSMPCT